MLCTLQGNAAAQLQNDQYARTMAWNFALSQGQRAPHKKLLSGRVLTISSAMPLLAWERNGT